MTDRLILPSGAILPVVLLSLTLTGALFFDGYRPDVLCVALSLLVLALATILWRGYARTLVVPPTTLVVSVTLYLLWLGLTLLWNPVGAIGTVHFWWLGSLAFAFWSCLLLPDHDWAWFRLAGMTLLVGLILTGMAIFQYWAQAEAPQSLFLDVNLHAAFLNIVALPVAGYFLACSSNDRHRVTARVLMACLPLLVYGVMLTGSRGAVLAHVLALGALIAFSWRQSPRRAVLTVLLISFGAFAAANVAWEGGLVERMGTLAHPQEASPERMLIWRSSWRLLEESPWWGIGLGMFPLFWPRYRHPEDGSAGYFAHNDYLQLWIEAGLPGLLILIAIFAAACWLCWRTIRDRGLPAHVRIEAAGLGAGLGTVAVHGFFAFQFYALPTIIVFGLILGRLQVLAPRPAATAGTVRFSRYLSLEGYRTILAAVTLLPLAYFTVVGLSARALEQGVSLAAQGQMEEADGALARAMQWWPASDVVPLARADLYRHFLARLPEAPRARRAELFQSAQAWLALAEHLNRWRPTLYLVRAELYRANPDLVAGNWARQVDATYRQALEYNPRYYTARYSYARFLLRLGRESAAKQILEEGMRYVYPNADPILPYFLLTYQMRERAGEVSQALPLRARIENYVRLRARKLTTDAETEAALIAMGLRQRPGATP